jgi:hypothetical protein
VSGGDDADYMYLLSCTGLMFYAEDFSEGVTEVWRSVGGVRHRVSSILSKTFIIAVFELLAVGSASSISVLTSILSQEEWLYLPWLPWC